jgi:hypothetical protein
MSYPNTEICVITVKWLSLLISKYFFILSFHFQLEGGSPVLLETPYSTTLEAFINLHLKRQHSIPVFLSAITVDLFSQQTDYLND